MSFNPTFTILQQMTKIKTAANFFLSPASLVQLQLNANNMGMGIIQNTK